MIVWEVCIVVLLIGLTVAAAVGKIGGSLAEPVSTHAHRALPQGTPGWQSVSEVRLDQGLRGYRMDQVDEVLGSLAAELQERDARIAALEARLPAGAATEAAAVAGTDAAVEAAAEAGTGPADGTGTRD